MWRWIIGDDLDWIEVRAEVRIGVDFLETVEVKMLKLFLTPEGRVSGEIAKKRYRKKEGLDIPMLKEDSMRVRGLSLIHI